MNNTNRAEEILKKHIQWIFASDKDKQSFIDAMEEYATQCQEDNKDKKYNLDDMKKACACGIDIACKEGENDFEPFADLINSLNKQDNDKNKRRNRRTSFRKI